MEQLVDVAELTSARMGLALEELDLSSEVAAIVENARWRGHLHSGAAADLAWSTEICVASTR